MTASRAFTIVGDRMALEPIVIRADATLTEAATLLDRHSISGLPVVDTAGCLVGVLSQTDLARARATEYLWANWPGLAVRHLMTTPAVTVQRSVSLAQAARKMERHRIHRLVVVADDDETLPIGILSMTDLVHAIAEETGTAPTPASSAQPSNEPSGNGSSPDFAPADPPAPPSSNGVRPNA